MEADGETKDPKKLASKPSVKYNISDVDVKEEYAQGLFSSTFAVALLSKNSLLSLKCRSLFYMIRLLKQLFGGTTLCHCHCNCIRGVH